MGGAGGTRHSFGDHSLPVHLSARSRRGADAVWHGGPRSARWTGHLDATLHRSGRRSSRERAARAPHSRRRALPRSFRWTERRATSSRPHTSAGDPHRLVGGLGHAVLRRRTSAAATALRGVEPVAAGEVPCRPAASGLCRGPRAPPAHYTARRTLCLSSQLRPPRPALSHRLTRRIRRRAVGRVRQRLLHDGYGRGSRRALQPAILGGDLPRAMRGCDARARVDVAS